MHPFEHTHAHTGTQTNSVLPGEQLGCRVVLDVRGVEAKSW